MQSDIRVIPGLWMKLWKSRDVLIFTLVRLSGEWNRFDTGVIRGTRAMTKSVEIALLRSTLRGVIERQTICGVESGLAKSILAELDRLRPEPPRMSAEEVLRRIETSLEDIRSRAEYLADL